MNEENENIEKLEEMMEEEKKDHSKKVLICPECGSSDVTY